PQLWNVVRGDMSLVGPRPELPEIVANYEEWQHRRHDVMPGLTGLWQVSARNGKPMHECTDVDLRYIEEMSFATDVAILFRTPAAMFHRRGF
ncbi:MAG TPA: sugar transferase, partial [Acidimicrobiia bacterium]|nr:sugar transferase [Acidimicrobiia bacterium]